MSGIQKQLVLHEIGEQRKTLTNANVSLSQLPKVNDQNTMEDIVATRDYQKKLIDKVSEDHAKEYMAELLLKLPKEEQDKTILKFMEKMSNLNDNDNKEKHDEEKHDEEKPSIVKGTHLGNFNIGDHVKAITNGTCGIIYEINYYSGDIWFRTKFGEKLCYNHALLDRIKNNDKSEEKHDEEKHDEEKHDEEKHDEEKHDEEKHDEEKRVNKYTRIGDFSIGDHVRAKTNGECGIIFRINYDSRDVWIRTKSGEKLGYHYSYLLKE